MRPPKSCFDNLKSPVAGTRPLEARHHPVLGDVERPLPRRVAHERRLTGGHVRISRACYFPCYCLGPVF